ncbi:hypothetical protein VP01_2031g5 [Puccinia sorghi]|uniref:Uncharacterized protein n=1 Tax=Puccinia sorghi TaxID=27349 RepID=A0A0L6VB43_9BASI|nr:hypothetical protein VP01_2031g5 [Puccinia sorghi]
MEAFNIAVHHEDQYIPLQISEVKDRAEKIPEEALKNYLEAIPQFSKQKSIIFTGLAQKNSMKSDYIYIKDSLKMLEKEAHAMHSIFKEMSDKPMFDLNKLSRNIQDLKDFGKLLTQGTTERLYKLKDQRSLIKIMEISHQKLGEFSRRVKAPFQHSKNDVSESILNSDVVEIISRMVWDGQIERLNAILHDLNSLKDDKDGFSEVNILIDKLQRNIFQTVDYMYKQEIISAKALKDFFQLKNTLELAALNMYSNPEMDKFSDLWHQMFRDKNPISTRNEWYCANYRSLYQGHSKSIL